MKISAYADKIYNSVLKHDVVAVDAPTGSGKTLFLPHYFASKGWKVRVAIPTIVAVESAYSFHSNDPSISVGMATSAATNYTDSDDIVYSTTGYHVERRLYNTVH